MQVTIVGHCEQRIFGLEPAERLRRQWKNSGSDLELVAVADLVLGENLIAWLSAHPEQLLVGANGDPLAVTVPSAKVDAASQAFAAKALDFPKISLDSAFETYDRKLRRRLPPLAAQLSATETASVEKKLFAHVYKGVTDFVTKWAWPLPAYWLTRLLAAARVHPNVVTLVGLVLVFVATWCFCSALFGPALLAAWGMTFLDTVDGKLARVTVTSSKIGDWLDHGTDIIHPPFWWLALGWGLVSIVPSSKTFIIYSTSAILACYVLGRLVEGAFKWQLGINQYMWRPFDSTFRLIVARRNPILAIMTVGYLAGAMVPAFYAVAIWSVVSLLIQALRYFQAWQERPIATWMAT